MQRNTLSTQKAAKKPAKKKIDPAPRPILHQTKPKLVIKQHLGRLLLPELFSILIVTAIFYGLILLNLLFLDVTLPENIYLFILFILISLVVLHLLITWHNRKTYVFHRDELEEVNGWDLKYTDIFAMKIKQNFFDKMFATGTLTINDRHDLKSIHRPARIKDVLVHVKE